MYNFNNDMNLWECIADTLDKITWQELSYEQEYIEYVNNAKNQAMIAYGSISSRCKGENNSESAHKCYDDVEMC